MKCFILPVNISTMNKEQLPFLFGAQYYRAHPAMQMWDVWNEPEQSFPRRTPSLEDLTCYCHSCRKEFIGWVKRKYGMIDALNDVWARCYEKWEEVELPRQSACVTDFID